MPGCDGDGCASAVRTSSSVPSAADHTRTARRCVTVHAGQVTGRANHPSGCLVRRRTSANASTDGGTANHGSSSDGMASFTTTLVPLTRSTGPRMSPAVHTSTIAPWASAKADKRVAVWATSCRCRQTVDRRIGSNRALLQQRMVQRGRTVPQNAARLWAVAAGRDVSRALEVPGGQTGAA